MSAAKSKQARTADAWFQPGPSGEVTVTLRRLRRKPSRWMVSVWGDDDAGMALETPEHDTALTAFAAARDGLTREILLTLGFRDAS